MRGFFAELVKQQQQKKRNEPIANSKMIVLVSIEYVMTDCGHRSKPGKKDGSPFLALCP
ncbi:hypothetical protein DVDV_1337 [Desulfovibrio sp. DV]|nr:hypothetical protein DVDV_1337 [Desulfovibrio sp. DV]